MSNKLFNLCYVFGHMPHKVDVKKLTAICVRCKKKLNVSYDMSYGDTIVEGESNE